MENTISLILEIVLYVIAFGLVGFSISAYCAMGSKDSNYEGLGFIIAFVAFITVVPAIIATTVFFAIPVVIYQVLNAWYGQHLVTRLSLWAGALFLLLIAQDSEQQAKKSRSFLGHMMESFTASGTRLTGSLLLGLAIFNSSAYWINVLLG